MRSSDFVALAIILLIVLLIAAPIVGSLFKSPCYSGTLSESKTGTWNIKLRPYQCE